MCPDKSEAGAAVWQPGRPAVWPYLLIAALLLLGGAVAHFWYLIDHCPLDLSGDEAHYWEWARRPALSYYSKGPLVAYVIALGRLPLAGWSEQLLGHEALAVRVPAILLSIGTGLGIFTLAQRTMRDPRLALAVVAVTFTVPILAVGAILMTIDAPLAFLYVWTLVAVEQGLRKATPLPWLVAGLLIALGILAKYTMVLIFGAVGLTLLVEPHYRAVLRTPWPWLAALISALGFAPIVVWNAQHDWVSFRHVAGQAGVSDGPGFDPLGPLTMVGGQLGVVSPVWFVSMVWAVVALWRQPQRQQDERHEPSVLRFLLCATVTPWLVFLGFSFITKIQPNWPMLALLSGIIVLVMWLARLWRHGACAARRLARGITIAGASIGVTLVLLIHMMHWMTPALKWLARNEPPWNLTPIAQYDPTSRLRGWSELGAAVGEVLEAERAGGRDPFIATDDYQVASQIAFYCPGEPTTYCLQAALGDRRSQYDIWRPNPLLDPQAFIGRACIYVGSRKPELFGEPPYAHVALPGALEPVRVVTAKMGGAPVQVWSIYVSVAYAGLPEQVHVDGERY